MSSWQETYRARLGSAHDALSRVESGQRVYVHMGAAAPQTLIEALVGHAARLRAVEVLHCITIGPAPYTGPEYAESFRHNALFVAGNTRAAVQAGRADFIPVFLHEIEELFTSGLLDPDVALIQATPPDRFGNMSLGPAVDISLTAAKCARTLIVEVNTELPRVCGDSFIHVSEAAAIVESSRPLPVFDQGEVTATHRRIAAHVAALVPDKATLQIGVGGIPEAVLAALSSHRGLGVHTEMFSDAIIELMESRAIDNAHKTLHPRKAVAAFALGTKRLYDYIHDNPAFEFQPCSYTNAPEVIAQNDRMVAVNSALEIDLSGQVCSDSIGSVPFSGVGGQVDFIRGAAQSRGGVPVIALPATAKSGALSRIVPRLKPGAGVVTSRADVRYVATEFGAVNLYGKSVRERAAALISIADPRFQAELEREAARLFSR